MLGDLGHATHIDTSHLQLNGITQLQIGGDHFQRHRGFSGVVKRVSGKARAIRRQNTLGNAGVQRDGFGCTDARVDTRCQAEVAFQTHSAHSDGLIAFQQGHPGQGESAAQRAVGDSRGIAPCACSNLHLQFVTRAQLACESAVDGLTGDIGHQIGRTRIAADGGDFAQSQGVNGGAVAATLCELPSSVAQIQSRDLGSCFTDHRLHGGVGQHIAIGKNQLVVQHPGA